MADRENDPSSANVPAPEAPATDAAFDTTPAGAYSVAVRLVEAKNLQAKMKKNTCGKTSFDSFDGMTCVEEPASGKWVCQ